jgi:hypothetical protein
MRPIRASWPVMGARSRRGRRSTADSLVTIPKTWLEGRIAQLLPEKVAALDVALRFSLGLG